MTICDDFLALIKDPNILLVPFDKIHVHIKELMEICTNIIFNEQETCNLQQIDYVLSYLHDHLNIGKWDEVPEYKKQAFTAASFIKAICILLKLKDSSSSDNIKNALQIVDKGFLLGLPLPSNPDLLIECAALLTKSLNTFSHSKEDFKIPNSNKKKLKVGCSNDVNNKSTQIDIAKCPSMEEFFKRFFSKEKPVVIQDCMKHWPAMTKWHDINYLLQIAGDRTVPIELGSSYSAENFSQKLMTLREFIKKYYNVEGSKSEEVGYLAQHDLLTQIPQLLEDVRIPEYCCISRLDLEVANEEIHRDPEINAWFGPQGTVSTLHNDPKDNLLCQVYGTKQILMFPPTDSKYLYPHEDILSNTSQVDPTNPNLNLHKDFTSATMFSCLINAGEMLYIPPKWWHHVTALEKSFSVNFWWK